jgi:hypothetical protein
MLTKEPRCQGIGTFKTIQQYYRGPRKEKDITAIRFI